MIIQQIFNKVESHSREGDQALCAQSDRAGGDQPPVKGMIGIVNYLIAIHVQLHFDKTMPFC